MQTKEWRFRDHQKYKNRNLWAKGPWDNEPDKKQWLDEATGLPCLIVRNGWGALCGYVGLNNGHPWFEQLPVEADVHGGITFGDFCSPNGPDGPTICHLVDNEEEDGHTWWIGFDCAHMCDHQPGLAAYGAAEGLGLGGTYRDFDYVTKEVTDLARQAKEVANG